MKNLIQIVFIGLSLLLPDVCCGRQLFSKVLIVDTVIGQTDSSSAVLCGGFREGNYFSGLRNKIQAHLNLGRFPNFTAVIIGDTLSETLRFSLDNAYGTFEIFNVFGTLSDTIRIKKLTIFQNCIPDTSESSIGWYRKFSESSRKPIHQISFKKQIDSIKTKRCNAQYPDSISVIVNGEKYSSPIKKDLVSAFKWYHWR